MWKLNNTLNLQIKEKMIGEFRKYYEVNENVITTYQNLLDAPKAVQFKNNDLSLHLEKLEKEDKLNPK